MCCCKSHLICDSSFYWCFTVFLCFVLIVVTFLMVKLCRFLRDIIEIFVIKICLCRKNRN